MSAAFSVSAVRARLVSVRRRRVKKRFNAHLMASRPVVEDRPARDRPRDHLPGLTARQVTQHVLRLDDGQQVGVAVAGAGVPFVLLHGIGFHNRTYGRCLSYLPEFGFLAVAIEAPGHGHSSPVARGADFTTRVGIFADGALMPRSAAACFDPDALVLRWGARPARVLPPRPDETVLDWRVEGLSGTGRRGSAKAADRAADWAGSR